MGGLEIVRFNTDNLKSRTSLVDAEVWGKRSILKTAMETSNISPR